MFALCSCRRRTTHPSVEWARHLNRCRQAKNPALFSQPHDQGNSTTHMRQSGGIFVVYFWVSVQLSNSSLLFSFTQGIQMTATTPSMRAVRFETGLIELELSNRIQCKAQPGGSSSYLKLFGKCQVDLNLALGQIVKHQVQFTSLMISK